jgi:hypothetical protein
MGLLAGASLWQTWNDRPALVGTVGLITGSLGIAAAMIAPMKLEAVVPYVAVLVSCAGLVAAAVGMELFVLAIYKTCASAGKRRFNDAR